MHLRKDRAGADSHGHTWEYDGAVVEVDDDLGAGLLALSGEFTDVTAEHEAAAADEEHDEPPGGADGTPPKRRRRTPVSETE